MKPLPEADRLRLLQGLRVKGRCDAARIASAWSVNDAHAVELLDTLRTADLVDERGGFFALSEAGERLRVQLLEAERALFDSQALESLYADFCELDPAFKQLVADIQRGSRERADAAPLLAPLHEQLLSLLTRVSALLPRLQNYAQRFRDSLAALEGGDPRYLASPLVESYHGIWFEFHEELIQASGRTRAEAAAEESRS